jgi:signal transduction histidine kinase
MDEPIAAQRREITFRDLNPASLFALAVAAPVVGLVSIWVWRERGSFSPHLVLDLALWTILVGAVELLPAPAWRGIHVSLGFPILTAVAITYPPGWAAAVALIGSTDPAEFRHETTLLKAIFNRCQVALAVFFSSATFHFFAYVNGPIFRVIAAALIAALVDYITNFGIVVFATSLMYRTSVLRLARTLPRLSEFLVSYAGLAILGVVLARLFYLPNVSFLAVLTVIAPLLFARQMFLRSHALEEAHVELTEREEILRELSNTMAEERADERLQIAGYLHDDLAQVLFRLSLQVDIARKLLDKGDVDDVRQQLDKIRESKQETSDRIRALIRDLHRSPLGAKGLAESLESFTDEVGRDSDIRFHRDVQDIELPAPIALLVFHIAREGIMNAVKHADPTDVSVTVAEQGEDIVLQLEDNGSGFDAGAPGPEGHYGMAMMRERAKVGGGSLEVRSGIGEGTTITVRFPIALLQREPQPGTEPPSANGPERASPGTPGTTSRSAEGSRDSVPA